MDADELVVREGVRDTIARYNHAGDSGRFDELVALFTPSGVLEIDGEPPHRGRDEIRAFLEATASDLAAATSAAVIRHHVTNVLIDVAGPRAASARSYFFVVTERGPDHWGRYRDRLRFDGGHWRFAHRRVRTDGWAPGSWVAERRTG